MLRSSIADYEVYRLTMVHTKILLGEVRSENIPLGYVRVIFYVAHRLLGMLEDAKVHFGL